MDRADKIIRQGKGDRMKYYFIVNPGSRTGKGKELWDEMHKRLEKSGRDFEVFYTKGQGDAKKAAELICKKDPDMKRIAVVGGDGTLNETVNGIPDGAKVMLGAIPTGSSNDFVRGVGIPSNTIKAFERVLVPRYFTKIDIGRTSFPEGGETRFAVSSSIGYDAQICHKALTSRLKKFLNRIGKGRLVYYITGIFLVFRCPHTKAEIIIDGKRKLSYKKLVFASAMNTRYEGGGMPMGPAADPTDGKITMCIVHDVSRLRHLFYMPSVIKANHVHKRGVEQITCHTCEIRTENPLCVHTDGEPCGKHDRVMFGISENKLRVMV